MGRKTDPAPVPGLLVTIREAELPPALREALDAFPGEVRFAEHGPDEVEMPAGEWLVLTRRGFAATPADPIGDVDAGEPRVQARPPSPFAPNRLYEEAKEFVERVLDRVRAGEDPDLDAGRVVAERMHTDLLRTNDLINRCLEPHGPSDLASHSVNVAVLAGKIAMGMVTGIEDAVQVVHAGLVHDIGMARLPREMMGNRGTWSEKEMEALRRHPLLGAEIVERCAPRAEWLHRAVLQEHERARGQGYPHGLLDREIDPIARILGVADVFEALSHPRSYRSPFTALEALERVVGMQDEYFSRQIVSALVNEISAFPLDSYVQISSGEIGRVVAIDPANILRPRVELVWDADWNRLEERPTLDLAGRPELTVARALLDSELPIT